jgi:hypothetical protein
MGRILCHLVDQPPLEQFIVLILGEETCLDQGVVFVDGKPLEEVKGNLGLRVASRRRWQRLRSGDGHK